jgi:hypothetical protein
MGLLVVGALALGTAGCGKNGSNPLTGDGGLLDPSNNPVLKQCGLVCPDKGIVDGNASISGVASVDGFFQAVINFQTTADNVSSGISAQVDAIRADFGVAAGADFKAAVDAQIKANLDGALTIKAEPAKCSVDAQATIKAEASCDATVTPGKAMVACKGGCDVKATATAMCDASADLKCTMTAPSVQCMGGCKGSCTADFKASASCTGTCQGECTGNCSAYIKNADGSLTCNGSCDAMCKGSCKTEFVAEAMCSGTCEGECTVTKASGGCDGGIKASCEAKANATVMCDGKCTGTFDPPKAKAECQASAKANASVNVQCTPPRIAISYKLKAVTGLDVAAQAKFVVALKNLEVRLPALLASIEQAKSVASAGEGLSASATGAVHDAIQAGITTDASFKAQVGLACAVKQLGDVGTALTASTGALTAQLTASADLTKGLGLGG